MYTVFYYVNLRWKYRIKLCHFIFAITGITLLLSYIYFINAVLWFLLCIVVNPIASITILLALMSIIFYIVYVFSRLREYRKNIEKAHNGNSNKIFEKIGLTRREMFTMMFFGAIINIMIAFWMICSWNIFYSNNTGVSSLISAFITPLGTFITILVQMKDIENKIKNKSLRVNDASEYIREYDDIEMKLLMYSDPGSNNMFNMVASTK